MGEALALDSEGNALLAGWTSGSLDGNSNAGGQDIFIMKFNASGSWQWTHMRGGPYNDNALAIALDSKGNAFVAGHTSSSLDGNSLTGGSDIFLMKFEHGTTTTTTKTTAPATIASLGACAPCRLIVNLCMFTFHFLL